MKTAVCCIIRNENAYLREFVEWYKHLGFDNVILYDNNFSDGESISDAIPEYISNGYVRVNNVKDKTIIQLKSYNECIAKYGPEYDWIAFFDCDEHLQLEKHANIHEFLSDFSDDVDAVVVNWMIMDDNDMLDNDGRQLEARFTRKSEAEYLNYKNIKENQHIKTILRCSETNIKNAKFPNPHYVCGIKKCVTAAQKPATVGSWNTKDIDFSIAYIKHFQMKTITEFLNNKLLKGSAATPYNIAMKKWYTIENFFKINKRTPEKETIAEKFFKENQTKIEERKKRG